MWRKPYDYKRSIFIEKFFKKENNNIINNVIKTKYHNNNLALLTNNYNNEIIIDKHDPNYSKDKNYYIVIVPTYTLNPWEKILSGNLTNVHLKSYYYLGVTNEFYPFVLNF